MAIQVKKMKLVDETQKIFNNNNIKITATVVRIPVIGGHSESVNIETNSPFEIDDIIESLKNTKGVVVQNNSEAFDYPMPITAQNKNDVFVGRIEKTTPLKMDLTYG